MGKYLDFKTSDRTAIAVKFENFENATDIALHMHYFHEFVMVTKGSCMHTFRGVEVPLIAGDVFIIPPHEPHSYRIAPNTCITNCYFFPERLEQLTEYMKNESPAQAAWTYDLTEIKNQYNNLIHTITHLQEDIPSVKSPVIDNLSRQGVLHLSPEEAMDVEALLRRIREEDMQSLYLSESMKLSALQMILIIFQRSRKNISMESAMHPDSRKQMILKSLTFMEENYPEQLTVKQIADASSLSESYFRVVFKEVTGLAPLGYLNRLRVIKALEYIQGEGLSIVDAAAKVGIYDANYFTRMFKKIMGHAPHYFKKIADRAE